MPGWAAHLPHAVVRVPPVGEHAADLTFDHRPHLIVQAAPAAQPDADRLQHGAPQVVLPLRVGGVADPHRVGAVVAGQLLQGLLGQVPLPVHPVHDLQFVVTLGEVGQEPEEVPGLPPEAERVQAP